MPGNKKPRKKRTEKPGTPLSIRFNAEHERALQIIPHVELDNLIKGRVSDSTFSNLALRVNFGNQIAHNFYEDDIKAVTQGGVDAMISVKERFARTSKYGASKDEQLAIGYALTLADDLQKNCTRREIRDALMYVIKYGSEED